jgi:hypothetical protein
MAQRYKPDARNGQRARMISWPVDMGKADLSVEDDFAL